MSGPHGRLRKRLPAQEATSVIENELAEQAASLTSSRRHRAHTTTTHRAPHTLAAASDETSQPANELAASTSTTEGPSAATDASSTDSVPAGNLYTFATSASDSIASSSTAGTVLANEQAASGPGRHEQTQVKAIIGIACAVAGVLLVAGIVSYFFIRRRRAKQSHFSIGGPVPLLREKPPFDDESYDDVDYPEAKTEWEGRPKSFLNSVETALEHSNSRSDKSRQVMSFQQSVVGTQKQPMSMIMADNRMTAGDPFKYGFGKGATALQAALGGDLHREPTVKSTTQGYFDFDPSAANRRPSQQDPFSNQHEVLSDGRPSVEKPVGQSRWW